MTVETATYINQLNSSNPVSQDAISEGDNHIALIKSTTANTFGRTRVVVHGWVSGDGTSSLLPDNFSIIRTGVGSYNLTISSPWNFSFGTATKITPLSSSALVGRVTNRTLSTMTIGINNSSSSSTDSDFYFFIVDAP